MDYSQLDKLDAEIAELKQRIAERDAKKVPQPKTNVGWASYIMNDDPHLLDMYQNAERQWNQMQEQNKLTKEISDANRAEQERYAMDDLRKQRTQAQAKLDTSELLLKSAEDKREDPDMIAKLKQEVAVNRAEVDWLNKRTGFVPKPDEDTQKGNGQVPPAAETPQPPTLAVDKVKLKNTKSFKTEQEKNDILSKIRSDAAYNTDPDLAQIENDIMKIQSDEAKKAAEEAAKAELAAANENFKKTGNFDKSKYEIEFVNYQPRLVRKNRK
jgi:hypothetical protein